MMEKSDKIKQIAQRHYDAIGSNMEELGIIIGKISNEVWKIAQKEIIKELKPLMKDEQVSSLFVNKRLIQKFDELVREVD